jgi:hypothetical protein
MGFFKKKTDPITDRSKALNAQIASLEAQIKALDQTLRQPSTRPVARPAAVAQGVAAGNGKRARVATREPVFEPVDRQHLVQAPEQEHTPDHFNDLGVRKYDLAAAWQRFKDQFRGPAASNPKLVTYLAAGSIRGLRPLRYEKRVARNRFIALLLILICLVWGIISVFVRTR